MNNWLRIFLYLLVLSAASVCRSAETKAALTVEAPPSWSVKYQGQGGLEFYTLLYKEDDGGLLMFSRWPPGGSVAQIPTLVNGLAKSFVAQAEKMKDLELQSTQYKAEEIKGEVFSGQFVQFAVGGGVVQTLFMFGDKEGIWNGQFTGTKERWAEAFDILRRLRKR